MLEIGGACPTVMDNTKRVLNNFLAEMVVKKSAVTPV